MPRLRDLLYELPLEPPEAWLQRVGVGAATVNWNAHAAVTRCQTHLRQLQTAPVVAFDPVTRLLAQCGAAGAVAVTALPPLCLPFLAEGCFLETLRPVEADPALPQRWGWYFPPTVTQQFSPLFDSSVTHARYGLLAVQAPVPASHAHPRVQTTCVFPLASCLLPLTADCRLGARPLFGLPFCWPSNEAATVADTAAPCTALATLTPFLEVLLNPVLMALAFLGTGQVRCEKTAGLHNLNKKRRRARRPERCRYYAMDIQEFLQTLRLHGQLETQGLHAALHAVVPKELPDARFQTLPNAVRDAR
jgi:hypothetical protein